MTSFEANFVGAELPSLTSLPRILESEKMKALGFKNTTSEDSLRPRGWQRKGVPFFWQESKTADLWSALLDFCQTGCVIDMSPGSGILALECFRRGIPYMGFTRSQTHNTWLNNRLDTGCVRLLSQTSHPLYQQTLGQLLQETLSDMATTVADEPLTESELAGIRGDTGNDGVTGNDSKA